MSMGGGDIRKLSVSFIFGVLLFVVYVAVHGAVDLNTARVEKRHDMVLEYVGKVALLDETLTMSAQMFVHTGEPAYQRRYEKAEQELAAVIKELYALKSAASSQSIADIDRANQLLLGMEHRALELVREAKRADATALLTSEDYLRQKTLYSAGMQRLFGDLQSAQKVYEARANVHTVVIRIMGLCGAVSVFAGWVLSLGVAAARQRAEKSLREAQEHLEIRVRERTEELKKSEDRYRLLAESAEDAIFTIDREERLVYTNKFGAALFGRTPQSLSMITMKELFGPSYGTVSKNLRTVFDTKKPFYAEQELDFGTVKRWIDARLIPLFGKSGEVVSIMGIARDVTERRRIEAESMLQLEALKAASNGIVITDVSGTIVWVNPAFTRMTGYEYTEAVGKTPRILKSGEQPAHIYKELWKTVLSGNSWTGELINRRKDGSLYFERQTVTPVRNEAGKITHFIAVKQDVSSDKKMEAQFRQAQKMEAVGRLAGGVAHDFNNLLTVIIGHADMALNEESADERMECHLTEIRKAGARAAGLTRQLLAFSRKQIFQMKVMDPNEIVRGLDKMVRRLLGEDIELVTLLGEHVPQVKVDPGQIEQVIMNLIVNARDAMPNGGKVVMETAEAEVDDRQAESRPGLVPGKYLRLTIRDTGTGISPETKAHLFEPFFTTKEKGKGTGLGLATVYGIIKQSRGFIYADSEPGRGAAFNIYLPPTEEAPTQSESDRTEELPSGSETILVAEDEDLVRGLAVQVLSRHGFRTLEARNGIDALSLAEKNRGEAIKMLITDMVMPHMGGCELADKISAKLPGVKIVFTSGYTDHSTVQSWIDRGCRFLQKPYTHAELLLTVREILDQG